MKRQGLIREWIADIIGVIFVFALLPVAFMAAEILKMIVDNL